MESSAASTSPACPQIKLLVSGERADLLAEAERIRSVIGDAAHVSLCDLATREDLSDVPFDIAVVIGGDGSMLRAAHQMGRNQRPIIGVNMGKLGFLADLSPAEFVAQLPLICSGKLPIVEHLMYECQLIRDGKPLVEMLGLNEVAIFTGPPFAILEVDLYVDAELVTTYSCDGLIVSTPVGSTAHNVSAGGPILRKDVQAFVVSPISPHTLTNRPVVDTADRIYELVVPRPHAGTTLVADGRNLGRLEPGDRVRIERSAARFKMMAMPGRSYYRTLREKLGWGGQLHRNGSRTS